MRHYDFDEIIERRGTDSVKYDQISEYYEQADLKPFWVADMDFRTPDFIVAALKKRLEHEVFGYTAPSETYFQTIQRWIDYKHDWSIDKEWLTFVPGIVKGIAYVLQCFTAPGDKVIIQPPVYHPFRLVPENLKREVVYNPLKLVDGHYEMDFEQLEQVIDEHCKVLILSNPHNPGGVVWSKNTLRTLANICNKHRVLVISDEIHAEMVYTSFKHYPFASVSEEAKACSITFMAPSKTFNIAGIISSYAIVPDAKLRETFYGFMSAGEFNCGNIFAYVATEAAYTYGAEWLQQMRNYVWENICFVDNYCKNHLPQIKAYKPQASFLVWLDCRELKLPQAELVELFEKRAGLALNDGAMFGPGGEGYMRLNVGCPRALLSEAMDRLAKALKE